MSDCKMDWSSGVKPLLAGSANNFTTHDLHKLCKTIVFCGDELLDHHSEYDAFYSRFVALSAHFICHHYTPGDESNEDVRNACAVLCEYVGKKVHNEEHVSLGQLVLVVKGLTIMSGCLLRAHVISLITKLKSSNLPIHVKNTIRDKSEEEGSPSAGGSVENNKRTDDLLASLFESVTGDVTRGTSESPNNQGPPKETLGSENIKSLSKFEVGTKLVQSCHSMKYIRECMNNRLPSVLEGTAIKFTLPLTTMGDMHTEMDTIASVVELPGILFQNTDPQLMCDVGLGSVVLAVDCVLSVMQATPTEADSMPDTDTKAYNILQSAVASVLLPVKNILCPGAIATPVSENFRALSCVVFGWGCVHVMHMQEATLVLCELLDQLLVHVAPLMKDSKCATCIKDESLQPVILSLESKCSALQRFIFVDTHSHVTKLMMQIAHLLVNAGKEEEGVDVEIEHEPPLLIDVSTRETTSTEDSTGDETLLGTWLEELFASVPHLNKPTMTRQKSTIDGPSTPLAFAQAPQSKMIRMSAECIRTINSALLSGVAPVGILNNHLATAFHDPQCLTQLVKVLDAGNESKLGELSIQVATMIHYLVANSILTHETQNTMVETLLSCKLDAPQDEYWPLNLSQRSLGVLARVLLIRVQNKEDDPIRVKTEALILSIWKRFNNSLLNDKSDEFVNVEQVQLLLVMFHSVQLLSKKVVFLDVATTVTQYATKLITQPITLPALRNCAAIMHIFEYMLVQFYQPEPCLVSHVRVNLLEVSDAIGGGCLYPVSCHLMPQLIELYTKASDKSTMFFDFLPKPWTDNDLPKLDGLAMNFLLSSTVFNPMYSALVNLFSCKNLESTIGMQKATVVKDKAACAVYLYVIVWRVIGQLPFPHEYLKRVTTDYAQLSREDAFNMIRLAARLQLVEYKQWIKDMLVKQDVTEANAQQLIESSNKQFAYPMLLFDNYIANQESGGGFMSWLRFYLVILRLKGLIATKGHRARGETVMNEEEMSCVKTLLNVTSMLRNVPIEAVEDAMQMGNEEIPPLEITRMLITVGQPCSTIESLSEAYTLCNSFSSWAPRRLSFAIREWSDAILDCEKTSEESKQMVTESSLGHNFMKHIVQLPKSCAVELLNISMLIWEDSVELVVNILYDKPNMLVDVDLDQHFLPHLFCHLLTPRIAAKIHSLINWTDGKLDARRRREKENGYFLSRCFDVILSHKKCPYEMRASTISFIVKQLAETIKKPCNWPAWVQILQDGELAKQLCKQHSENECPALEMMAWIEVMMCMMQHKEDNDDMKVIHSKLLVPCLQYDGMMTKWADAYVQVALDHLLAEIRETNVASLRPSGFIVMVEKVTEYMRQHEQHDWVTSSSNIFIHGLSTMVHAFLYKPTGECFHGAECLLRVSDACMDSALDMPPLATFVSKLMPLLVALGDVNQGQGHVILLESVIQWIAECINVIGEEDNISVLSGIETSAPREQVATLAMAIDTSNTLLSYVRSLLSALAPTSFEDFLRRFPVHRSVDISMFDANIPLEDSGGGDEDDSGGEDSADEQADSQVCTFVMTAKEFMNQHWYHCHTCDLVEGEGVCTVCARVCHREHDLSYSKFGSFFCDCGAKANGCLALTKRSTDRQTSETNKHSSLKKIVSTGHSSQMNTKLSSVLQMIDSSRRLAITKTFSSDTRTQLETILKKPETMKQMEGLVRILTPAVVKGAQARSASHSLARRRRALHDYTNGPHKVDSNLRLMEVVQQLPDKTLENVKLNLAGEQLQTLRQALQSHHIDRKAVTSTLIPETNKQVVVVGMEKNKLAVYLANNIVKPKGNHLARCGFDTMPFTIVSLTAMDECIAVCGHHECQMVCLSSTGAIVDRMNVKVGLEGHNYIIKAVWCPDTRGLLAVITSDFTNVYDVTVSLTQPRFQFEPPVGKIRDAVFTCWEHDGIISRHLLIMSSLGYVYLQALNQDCEYVQHGAFFVTNMLHVENLDMAESSIAGGGVSIHYSHALQLAFMSYHNGITVFGHLSDPSASVINNLTTLLPNGVNSKEEPLCDWMETREQPGLIMACKENSGSPCVFYMGVSGVYTQDMQKSGLVGCTLVDGGNHMTHAILVTEAGAVIVMSPITSRALDLWVDWSSPTPFSPLISPFNSVKTGSTKRKTRPIGGAMTFPVDFFETCQQIQDLEFGGKDMLHIYNVQQLKNRLSAGNLYVVSEKPGGFTVEVSCKEPGLIACGLRIELGKQSVEGSPSYISVFGRTREVAMSRPRWVDIPFTLQEALLAANKFSVQFGPSSHASGRVWIDSVRVYGRPKEGPGWFDDSEPVLKTSSGQETSKEDRGSDRINRIRAPYAPEVLEMTALDTMAAMHTAFGILPLTVSDNLLSVLPSHLHLAPIYTAKIILNKIMTPEKYHETKDFYCVNKAVQLVRKCVPEKDPNMFSFGVMLMRNVAVSRPAIFVKCFANGVTSPGKNYTSLHAFLSDLLDIFWKVCKMIHPFPRVQPVSQSGGLDVGCVVRCVVEMVHCFAVSNPTSNFTYACNIYTQLLLSEDIQVNQACRLTLAAIYRTSTRMSKSDNVSESSNTPPALPQPVAQPPLPDNIGFDLDPDEEADLVDLLGVDEIGPPDVDDEAAMVELAIALSLQQEEDNSLEGGVAPQEVQETLSDTSASGFSDEEGSNIATEGLSLNGHIPSNAPSESGASVAESASGPGSVCGGDPQPITQVVAEQNVRTVVRDVSIDQETVTLRVLSQNLVEYLIGVIPRLRELHKGMRCIAILQTLLSLTNDVDVTNDRETFLVHSLVDAVLKDLNLANQEPGTMVERSAEKELQLLKLRLVSVLLQKIKTRDKTIPASNMYIASHTAKQVANAGAMTFCKRTLQDLLPFWKNFSHNVGEDSSTLLTRCEWWWIDLSPFFLSQFVQENGGHIFESYAQLLTEMALRLPYQMRKVQEVNPELQRVTFDQEWEKLLCQLVSCQEAPFVRRQARKLLLVIAGSKDNYRCIRDQYSIMGHISSIRQLCTQSPAHTTHIDSIDRPLNVSYTTLNELMEHLGAINEVASGRVANWQKLCTKSNGSIPMLLMKLACIVNHVLSQVIVDLLQAAVCATKSTKASKGKFSTTAALSICRCLMTNATPEPLNTFLHRFLLRCNVADRRMQAHLFVLSLFQNILPEQQNQLLQMLWTKLWPQAANHGSKAAQLVDLIAYYTMQLKSSAELQPITEQIVESLKSGLDQLFMHPNADLYRNLSRVLDLDGYYLEDNPCLVCNNPEVAYAMTKLSAVKVDSRFTTSSQIVKMNASYEITRITVKLTEVKRKMIKTMNIYYSNRTVSSAVDLKNKPELWLLAKKVNVGPNETEMKLDLLVPIVACNMMVDFTSFYDKNKGDSELVHCPRCSASVPANPGVCTQCGENVFQCHKCRAINYDEKDPFLCNSCGFSKYAKFDIVLNARTVASVEPIQNDGDRAKTLTHINQLLEKADQTHNQLLIYRLQLERVNTKMHTRSDKQHISATVGVSPDIQALSHLYSRDCKMAFEDLSRTLQRVLVNRAELLQYDSRLGEDIPVASSQCLTFAHSNGRCYGCMSAQLSNCVRVVRALCTNSNVRKIVTTNTGLLDQLANAYFSLTSPLSMHMKELLCELSRDSVEATEYMCTMIKETLMNAIVQPNQTTLSNIAANELQLMSALLDMNDSLWEMRVKCVYHVFIVSVAHPNRLVMEYVTAPCLTMLHCFLEPSNASQPPLQISPVNLNAWLVNDSSASYESWKTKQTNTNKSVTEKSEYRRLFLINKYGGRWLTKCGKRAQPQGGLLKSSWLEKALFYPNSVNIRMSAASTFTRLAAGSPQKKTLILDTLADFMDRIALMGERTAEYVTLFKALLVEDHCKFYLSLRGFLPKLSQLITAEVERLTELEMAGMGADVSQGYSIKVFSDLLHDFMDVQVIASRWKSDIVACVLHGYLALKRLVLQRTKMVDEAETKLLSLLEDLTSGTQQDTIEFMAICVATVNKYPDSDFTTPVFIFERLCSIIYPEEKEIAEFLVTIQKDPAQEEFLQGRMMNNPYSSTDLGKLMKDVKNRICRDCELIALLDDDTGMELIVQDQIISLELPLAEVYKKMWRPSPDGNQPMLIMYRMRGLLGDATEEFIETLDSNKDSSIDEEHVYRMAHTMATNGGLQAILYRLSCIGKVNAGRPLLTVILKLLPYCVKLNENRKMLMKPELKTFPTLLTVLKLVVTSDESGNVDLAQSILDVMDILLKEAELLPTEECNAFSKTCGSAGDMVWLLSIAVEKPELSLKLAQIIPNLSLGCPDRMAALVDFFAPSLQFNNTEYELDVVEGRISRADIELACLVANSIQVGDRGAQLKQLFIDVNVVRDATEFLIFNCPPFLKPGQTADSPEWDRFLIRPSLKDVLRLLTGLCKGHQPTQSLVAQDCIAIIHKLEQISTTERLGSLAENLLEALRGNPDVANKIEQVRKDTRRRKKQLAMAMREKQLEDLGMKMTDKGLVKVNNNRINSETEPPNETGLVCCICKEGYKFEPEKVLGIYTYTSRVNAEEREEKARKTPAYSTVTHFNVIHYDCHLQAVRNHRNRDEWSSAQLHNANTLCNGLLPLWGNTVPDSNFSHCLNRHHGLIQEQCSIADISHTTALHDLKMLLMRFANNQSFSGETGGGGKESNVQLIPCLSLLVLYMMQQDGSVTQRTNEFNVFLDEQPTAWTKSVNAVESSIFWTTFALLLLPPETWKARRLQVLKRLLYTAHARHVHAQNVPPQGVTDVTVREFDVYKSMVILFVFVDMTYTHVFKDCVCAEGETWPTALLRHLHENDMKTLESSVKMLDTIQQQIYPCQSFLEIIDAAGLLSEIPNADGFLADAIDVNKPLIDLD